MLNFSLKSQQIITPLQNTQLQDSIIPPDDLPYYGFSFGKSSFQGSEQMILDFYSDVLGLLAP
jgi:hypothetical protein